MADIRSEVSVVIPAYNEAEQIKKTLEVTAEELSGTGLFYELIVVDDGSVDRTSEVVEGLCGKRGRGQIRLVSYFPNQGKGFALKRGVYEARSRYIAFFDADLDISPDHIHRYLDILKKRRADAVIASKRHSESKLEYSRIRTFISNIYYFLNRFLFRMKIRDTQSGMKIFRRSVLENAIPRLLVKRFAFDLELLVILLRGGAQIIEAPVRISGHNEYGRIGVMALWHAFVDTLAVFYRFFFLHYYNWEHIPRHQSRREAMTLLIDSAGYSNRLADLVEYVQSGVLGTVNCVILADKGNFVFPGVRVIETGAVEPIEKLRLALDRVRSQYCAFIGDRALPPPGWLLNASGYLNKKEITAIAGPVCERSAGGFFSMVIFDARFHPVVKGRFRIFSTLKRQRPISLLPLENISFRRTQMAAFLQSTPIELINDEGIPFLDMPEGGFYSPDLLLFSQPLYSCFRDYLQQIYRVSVFRGQHSGHGHRVVVAPFLAVFFLTATLFAFFSEVFRGFYFAGMVATFGLLFLSVGSRFRPARGVLAVLTLLVAALLKGTGVLRGFFLSSKKHREQG